MRKTLNEIMNDVKELEKHAVEELSLPIQELVNMVNNKEINSYSLIVRTIREIGISPYTCIMVKIDNPAIAILGLGEGTSDEIFGYNPIIKTKVELKEKLLEINNKLSAINKYIYKGLPLNKHETQDSLYYYSLDRKQLKKSWTVEEAKKWPMMPDFLENLIDFNEPIKQKKLKK